jgi:hypothetical protein
LQRILNLFKGFDFVAKMVRYGAFFFSVANIIPSSIIINIDLKYTSTAQVTGLHKTLLYVSATLHNAIT